MPSKKISQLSGAATLAGTEVLAGYQLGGDVGITPAMLATYMGTTVNAAHFPGATAGDQITAALATLPAHGGTVDARGITNTTINGLTISISGTTILFPALTFTVTASIVVSNAAGLNAIQIKGCGSSPVGNSATGFVWAGNATDPVFLISGVRDSNFSDFFIGAQGVACRAGIQSQTLTATSMTNNRFYNIVMFGASKQAATGLQKGWRWVAGTGGDNNNSENYLAGCGVFNYGTTAYSIEHSQSLKHVFVNCQFNAGNIGVNCLNDADFTGGGSFVFFGGGGGNQADADFVVTANDFNMIQAVLSENSNRFIRTGGTSVTSPLSVIANRFATNSLNADNIVINCNFQGGCTMVGNTFDSVATGRSPAFVQANNSGKASGSVAIGNNIFWDTAVAGNNPFQGTWSLSKNWVIDRGSQVPFPCPDTMPMQGTAPISVSAATYSQTGFESSLIFTGSGATVTLLTPAHAPGLKVRMLTTAAHAVISASSNVVAITGGAASTAILAGTSGKWADLECDGTSWIITAAN